MKWNLPNALTVLRLLAAPGVPLMFLFVSRPFADFAALALFVLAAVTDWFDGYIARLWGQESRFGAAMDPIADKAMVVIALVVMTGYSAKADETGKWFETPLPGRLGDRFVDGLLLALEPVGLAGLGLIARRGVGHRIRPFISEVAIASSAAFSWASSSASSCAPIGRVITICLRSLNMASMSMSGRGGQPGTYMSTGTRWSPPCTIA